MAEQRSTVILLALVCGAIAGGAIGFVTANAARDAPTADARDPEVLARLNDIADRLKSIHADLSAGTATRDGNAAPASSTASDPKLVATLESIREELKQNTATVGALANRPAGASPDGATIAASHPDLDAKAVEKVKNALAVIGPTRTAMQRSFLLKTPAELVAELGRPSWINFSRTDPGVTWVYDTNGDGTPECTVQLNSGYVVRLDP